MVLVSCVLACGGSPSAPALPSGPPAVMIAQATGPDDTIVASVAGRPVYASCVSAQAKRNRIARDAALRESGDLELLAQEAEARGLTMEHEVAYQTRRELVSRLVETDFERKYQTPDDLKPQVDAELERNKHRMQRPELRRSTYVRVVVPEKSADGVDAAAHALADKIYAALANETGLFSNHVRETAERLAKGTTLTLDIQDYKAVVRNYTDATYDAALYGISDVGRISPVTRTPWGYDIVLLTEIIEPKTFTREEVVPLIFADARRLEFDRWATAIRASLNVTVLRDDSLLDPRREDKP
ncbi:MAG: peptidylprolyl isomerase [Kofleriaceae bacterium]